MYTIDTHGRKIKLDSLATTSEYTDDILPPGGRIDIFYNRINGRVWGTFELENNWTEYRQNPEVIRVGSTDEKLSQQEIADMIDDEVGQLEYYAEQIGEKYSDTF